ncbi:DNA-processing protein DprA [Methylomagnum sp.]
MVISNHTQAVLLLTAHFGRPAPDEAKPLGPKEWGRFALWLKERGRTPEQLLTGDPAAVLDGWDDRDVTHQRVERLVNRGAALGLALEKWLRAGLWVMTRSEADYPARLKQRLKLDSPPLLFGCGNPKLLNQGGLAVVGSRDADADDLDYSRGLGRLAAERGYSVVSGGARGVDEAAMLGALAAEGTVIGVMADSLLSAAASARFRRHVMNRNLVLISPFYPEAGFNAGNAMARNKYIYCLGDAAAVVRTDTKGGTWSGAMENLRRGWVPLWVRDSGDEETGNDALIQQGGRRLAGSLARVDWGDLLGEEGAAELDETDLASLADEAEARDAVPDAAPEILARAIPAESCPGPVYEPSAPVGFPADMGFYELFLLKLQSLLREDAKTPDELAEALDLEKAQVKPWLKRAVAEFKLETLAKPVRYRWREDLFGGE